MDANPVSDIEAIVAQAPKGEKLELRLWLRMLSCASLVSADIRRNLRRDFATTLPRFDLLAQLQREPQGLRLGELSARMMVTNGNITGLVDTLVAEGFVQRESAPDDRRAAIVRMTKAGAQLFTGMAEAHERWLARLFQGLDRRGLERLIGELETLKRSIVAHRDA